MSRRSLAAIDRDAGGPILSACRRRWRHPDPLGDARELGRALRIEPGLAVAVLELARRTAR